MAEKQSEILVKSGEKGLLSFVKVTAHSGCWEINFPFQAKCPLCFIDPYLLSHPHHSLGSQDISEPKTCRWNSEQNNRCIKNTTSVDNCMWLCWTQLLEDIYIFERADSQLGAWALTENLRMPMRVCTSVCMCVLVRVCLRVLNLCFTLKDKEGWWGSQSVPLQINSLIPDPSFLQTTHYLHCLASSLSLPFSQYFPYPPTVPGILRICVGDDKPGDVKAA